MTVFALFLNILGESIHLQSQICDFSGQVPVFDFESIVLLRHSCDFSGQIPVCDFESSVLLRQCGNSGLEIFDLTLFFSFKQLLQAVIDFITK